MKYVFCLGEVLIDFTSAGELLGGAPLFEQNAGGAPANVACALSRLGTSAYMCAKVGTDMFGSYLRRTLEAEGVNSENLYEDSDAATTLAFVALDKNGERSFAFVRNPGADTRLRFDEVNLQYLRQAAVLHFGTLSLTHEPSRTTLMQAVALARTVGVTTSIDVNLRLRLWENMGLAHAQLHKILPWCDVVKLSCEELNFAFQARSCTDILNRALVPELAVLLMDKYPQIQLLCVTLGSEGSMAFFRSGASRIVNQVEVAAFKVAAVDTTGAGDAFMAGMLHKMLEFAGLEEFLGQGDNMATALQFANACAALCVTKRGAIAAMPYIGEVDFLLKTRRTTDV
ncbi:MAG: fructokinase [Bacillota bacterium]|nr:MAG: fructokinase [Bacillota bacterium]